MSVDQWCAVLALVREEKRREKKSRLPLTPRNLSIHKHDDDENYQPSSRPDIPVVSSDGQEVFMGETLLLLTGSITLQTITYGLHTHTHV